ncbi:Chitinase 1 [Pleurostoma richardsiae]|uniref:Chitinase 1 n=1 Tax=Pleurostoma richardsiae TaxID=41990 RepID=A0AA38R5Z9_9PEZI|nr:Chitinase 1 [Pleurostoma richardsiae]
MKSLFLGVVSLLAALSLARPFLDVRKASLAAQGLPRLVIYYQTTHDSNGNPISMLPLVTEKNISLTHLIVCSFHINFNSEVHLNNFPPSDSRFYTLWNETEIMKAAGVKVMGMVGGAAAGSFNPQTLDGGNATFEHYYGQLRDVISDFGLQGMDLDVEQSMSQAGIERLVDRLYADFGSDFIITLAPVASALRNGGNLSGFDYENLEADVGTAIDFYNAQFYNGFGSMASTTAFDAVISNGWNPEKIVVGQITSPDSGSQFVPFATLNQTIIALRKEYGEIGGIMGWEYFNSQPGGTSEPWEWAEEMTKILRPYSTVTLNVTAQTAAALEEAWTNSVISADVKIAEEDLAVSAKVDYQAMVNA